MKKAVNAFCFVMLEVFSIMYCSYMLSKGYAIILTIGLVIANIVFCVVYSAEIMENENENEN